MKVKCLMLCRRIINKLISRNGMELLQVVLIIALIIFATGLLYSLLRPWFDNYVERFPDELNALIT